jgi:hypothetical protein
MRAANAAAKLARGAALALGVMLVASAALVAQSDDPRKPDPYINKYVSMMQLSTLKSAPYSLERETVGPGKHLDKPVDFVERYRQYRDSRGWLRAEMFEPQPVDEDPSGKLAMVQIFDADNGQRYLENGQGVQSWTRLDAHSIAYAPDVHGWPAGLMGAPANGSAGKGDYPYEIMTVSIGEDTMLGLHVIGIRQTGTRGGVKDYEIEGWFSPELQLPILVKSDDKRGHVERRVTKLERGEPDASLFVLPTEYKTPQPAKVITSAPASKQ